jgi:elongation factor 2
MERVNKSYCRTDYTHNVSIIGSHDCSKTLFEYLSRYDTTETPSAHFVPADEYYLHPRTIKFNGTKVHYSINLINTPGHSEFIDEAGAALRITDGAIVVIDCEIGVTQHAIDVVRKAVSEHVNLVLLFDKIESLLKLSPEKAVDVLDFNLWKINSRVPLIHNKFALASDNVFFGSTEHKWIVSPAQLSRSLKPTSDEYASNGATLETFMRTLCKLFEDSNSDCANDKLSEQLANFPLSRLEGDQRPSNALFHSIMQTICNAETIYEMIINRLPSAAQAQKYRAFHVHEGSHADEALAAMIECDPTGPSVLFISKIIWSKLNATSKLEPIAIGRVFSGSIRVAEPLWLIEPNQTPDKRSKVIIKAMYAFTSTIEELKECTSGAIVMIPGNGLSIGATLSSLPTTRALSRMKSSSKILLEYGVESALPASLPRLVQTLKWLSKSEITASAYTNDWYGHCIGAVGPKHAEVLLKRCRRISEIELVINGPIVRFRESISAPSILCLAKSPNKLNRVWIRADPMDPLLLQVLSSPDLEVENVQQNMEVLNKQHLFMEECLVQNLASPNVISVNNTLRPGIEWMDSLRAGSLYYLTEGVLCADPLMGVKFTVEDVSIAHDALRRGAGQLIPTFRRSLCATQLTAKPVLLEAILFVEMLVETKAAMELTRDVLVKRRAVIAEEEYIEHSDMYIIRCHMPVSGSLELPSRVVSSCFSRWQQVPGVPLEEGSLANEVVIRVRKAKGLKESIPALDVYLDKL